MIRVTFLVGNGFDVALGLKTSYKDFYDWYCKQPTEKSHIQEFKKSISDDIKNGGRYWSDFEAGLGKYTKQFSAETVQQFFECYEDAQKNMLAYIEEEENKYEWDITPDQTEQFRKGLLNYLNDLTPKERQAIERLYPPKGDFDIIETIISFNYTNCLDTFVAHAATSPLKTWDYKEIKHKTVLSPKVIHVHGTLNYLPTFGVNDESQVENKELLSDQLFSELMIKPQYISASGELWHDEAAATINASNIICIFGMSLGDTDKVWFRTIMDWLRVSGDRHLIVFWHTNQPSNNRSSYQKTFNRIEAKKKMTVHASYSMDIINGVSNRIHIIENTKTVFNLKLKKKEKPINLTEIAAALELQQHEAEYKALDDLYKKVVGNDQL